MNNSNQLQVVKVDLDKLSPDPANARKHSNKNIDAIKSSLRRFGQRIPLVVQKKGMVVRAGNARLRAMHELGWESANVVLFDDDEATAIAFAIADNRTAELANWDEDILASLAQGLDDTDMIGFSDGELQRLINSQDPSQGKEIDVPENILERVEVGDVWKLGKHRLYCGDCLATIPKIENVFYDAIVTDPPYNVSYVSKTGNRKKIAGDDLSENEFRNMIGSALRQVPMAHKNNCFLFMAGSSLHLVRLEIEDSGFCWGDYLVWVKNSIVHSMRKDYSSQHEFIVFFWKGSHRKLAPKNASTVWFFDRPHASKEHPTMKPLALVEQLVTHATLTGGRILDPFGGSGTTLLACESQDRICDTIEIDPRYCDVIISRWEGMSGRKAKKNGKV